MAPDEAVVRLREANDKDSHVVVDLITTMLEEAHTWGRDMGCVEAKLHVLAGNPARRLYEDMGFDVFELEMRLEL